MRKKLFIIFMGLALTGCAAKPVTVYTPEPEVTETETETEQEETDTEMSPEAEQNQEQEEVKTEKTEIEQGDDVEVKDPDIVYDTQNVTVRFLEADLAQNSYYVGFVVDNHTDEDMTVKLYASAVEGKVLSSDEARATEMYITPGLSSVFGIDFDLTALNLPPADEEGGYDGVVSPNLCIQLAGDTETKHWRSGLIYLGEKPTFHEEEQIEKIYDDEYISIYNNGEVTTGKYDYVVYNKTEETLQFHVEQMENDGLTVDYYILNAENLGSLAMPGLCYVDVDINIPAASDDTRKAGVNFRVFGDDGMPDITIPIELN